MSACRSPLLIVLCFLLGISVSAVAGICPGMNHLNSEFQVGAPYAEVYDDVLEVYEPHIELREMHAKAMPRGRKRIIDGGGGTGLLTRHALADDSRRQIEIFDPSEQMTAMAVEKGVDPDNIHLSSITNLVRTNGERVPDESIDGIMSNNVIYILKRSEVDDFFDEAHRVLKKGGILSLSSMRTVKKKKMAWFLRGMKANIAEKEKHGIVPPGSAETFFSSNQRLTQDAPTTFTHDEIIRLARRYGFRPLVKRGFGYQGTAFFVSFEKL